MDRYEVIPHMGVGPVRLGMSRSDARSAMALPFRTFRKSSLDPSFTDAYLNNCFQVFFDETDIVEFIELSNPLQAVYKDELVFQVEAETIVKLVENDAVVDNSLSESGYSFIFPSLDLSLWRPTIPEDGQAKDDPEGRYFMTIGIGRPGYFHQS